MHVLIPVAVFGLLGGILNATLAGPVSKMNTAIFRGLGYPESFVSAFCSEEGIRLAGWIMIGSSLAMMAMGLFSG